MQAANGSVLDDCSLLRMVLLDVCSLRLSMLCSLLRMVWLCLLLLSAPVYALRLVCLCLLSACVYALRLSVCAREAVTSAA